MKPERQKIIKKHTNNATLAKIEKWLREESKQGWRLIHIKEGLFQNTYHFLQGEPSDEVYVAPADFVKQPSYRSTMLSVLAYLKFAYGGKKVSKKDFCLWIRLSKSKITNVRDVKQNLLCRERCIKKDYLMWTIVMGIGSLAFFIASLFEGIQSRLNHICRRSRDHLALELHSTDTASEPLQAYLRKLFGGLTSLRVSLFSLHGAPL